MLAGRSAQTKKNDHLQVFLAFYSQVFLQDKGWLILELHEITKVPYAVTFSIFFILFYDQD